jgi:hypothetical protein
VRNVAAKSINFVASAGLGDTNCMKPRSAHQRSKDILSAIMDVSQPAMIPWSPNDLRAILEHQLATPLAMEIDRLTQCSGCNREEVSQLIEDSKCRTFGEFLAIANPSRKMLAVIKDFAKSAMSDSEILPRDVARIIYVSVILRGRQIKGRALTTLDADSIEREARRCLSYGWLPESTRDIIRKGLLRC